MFNIFKKNVRVLVTGDTHGNIWGRFSSVNPDLKGLTKNDIVIIAGDFGVIWANEKNVDDVDYENRQLNYLNDRGYTILVVGGNHENWPRLLSLPKVKKFGVELGKIRDNVFFIPNGTIMTLGGKRYFFFGGALSIDKHMRLPDISWWKEEIPSNEVMQQGIDNLDKVKNKVDVIVTHTMDTDSVRANGFNLKIDPVSNYLRLVKNTTKYSQWFCGHFHQNKKFGDIQCVYDRFIEVK